MSPPPNDRHTATRIEISLQEEVLGCLDDYCDVFAIDRSMAIGHLLQGALHSALPDPDWFQEDKPLTANASANSRDSASRTLAQQKQVQQHQWLPATRQTED